MASSTATTSETESLAVVAAEESTTSTTASTTTASNKIAEISEDGLTVNMHDSANTAEEKPLFPKKEKPYAGQFETLEELESKYKELLMEKEQREQQQASPKEEENKSSSNDTKEAPKVDTREDAEKALKSAQLDIASFEQEYTRNGALSQESYAKLKEAGFSQEMVDRYIHASTIISDAMINTIKESVGGAEAYAKMSAWALDNLPSTDIEHFNSVMTSGNINLIKMCVQNLNYKYKEANGSHPQIQVTGRASAHSGITHAGFRSTSEMVAAMRDARYGKDSAYTREVENRVALSQF